MGTSCLFRVEGTDAAIYQHYDGDPQTVLPWLLPFSTAFFAARGHDPQYFLAQCLFAAKFATAPYTEPTPTQHFNGWGVTAHEDSTPDVDYIYDFSGDGACVISRTRPWRITDPIPLDS